MAGILNIKFKKKFKLNMFCFQIMNFKYAKRHKRKKTKQYRSKL